MSESEEENEATYFGTPLEPYDEDAFPKKRPITVEEQVARDAQGRRRFHGAFTGGFSAGFFNTVGSLEGWMPREFKSSRSDKAQNKLQKPEDFMDDEDLGEFGIAPQTVRATDDYSTNKKRKKKIYSDGPIPGEPVLETLLQAGNETVGYFLMKNMNQKHRAVAEKPGPKVYGCVMPKDLPEEDVYEDPKYDLHKIYKQHLAAPKSNTFGIGYIGLDKSHISLFQPTHLTVHERNNKKLSIAGQAFGVGAFEDDDEDIYVKDDMSRYDFELGGTAKKDAKGPVQKGAGLVLDMFVLCEATLVAKENFPPPVIPSSFTGKHNVRKSRFEPLPEEAEAPTRKDINVTVRAKYLGEGHGDKTYTPSNQQHKQPVETKSSKTRSNDVEKQTKSDGIQAAASEFLLDRFVSAKQDDDPTNLLEPVKPTEMDHGTKEMHAAVKMKMFGPLTRVTIPWQPNSLLCKRFNVPESHVGELNAQKNKKRTKNLIFEYQKHAENDSLHKPGLSIQQTPNSPLQVVDSETSTENKSSVVIPTLEPTPTDIIDVDNVKAASSAQHQEVPPGTEEAANKSPSEKVVDITERVDVSKNIDLFKAVFLSSSESESEDEAVEQDEHKKRKEELTANVLAEPLVPKIISTKEGILSNIDFSKFSSAKLGSGREERQKEVKASAIEDAVVDDNVYGPKLPSGKTVVNSAHVKETVVNNDEWVEKDKVEKHKKHKKKHKKERDREKSKKKHKHKSKR